MNEKESEKQDKPPAAKQNRLLSLAAKARSNKYRKLNPGPFYAWPMGLWFTLFFIVPLLIIVCYSFMKQDVHGGVIHQFTLKAFSQVFSVAYGKIFLRTLWVTSISTAITLIFALPAGYAMARSKKQTLLLILVIIPFLTNSLIRIFAWKTILEDNGILNNIGHFFFTLWHSFGFGNPDAVFTPHKFMYTQSAVILVNIYMYLPYAILPVFSAVDRFDFSLLEAARDLGATKPQSMLKVLIPGIKSGIVSALIFTFIPIFGTYTVPQLVGGIDSYMLGTLIVDQVTKARNWPLASAFSLLITATSMLGILWMLTTNKKEAESKKTALGVAK